MTGDENTGDQKENRYLRFFRSPSFLAITVGIPFCIFKCLFGILAFRIGTANHDLLAPAGVIILVWAGTDIVMNVVRAALDLAGKGDSIEYCSLAQFGRLLSMPSVFLAVDTLLSFSIICYTLWSGWIRLLLPFESSLWNTATTLNLISLSLVLLATELWMEAARRNKPKN